MTHESPFRAEFHLSDGKTHEFPASLSTVRRDIESLTRVEEPLISPRILDHLDDRVLLLESGLGTFHMRNARGDWWPIPARSIVTVRISDPAMPGALPRHTVGFNFDSESSSNAEDVSSVDAMP